MRIHKSEKPKASSHALLEKGKQAAGSSAYVGVSRLRMMWIFKNALFKSVLQLALILTVVVYGVSKCTGPPDCDGFTAKAELTESIYRMVQSKFPSNEKQPIENIVGAPPSLKLTDRNQQITDAYFPSLSMRNDAEWLKYAIAPTVPAQRKFLGFRLFFSMDSWAVLRKAIDIRITDYEDMPHRTVDARVYKKICKAKIWISPKDTENLAAKPVIVTYSINSKPRSSRTPFYIPVNYFEASAPPLSFELSKAEEVILSMSLLYPSLLRGTKQAPVHDAQTILTLHALRALRQHYEHRTASGPPIEAPPVKP
jgi:hypothetical protein